MIIKVRLLSLIVYHMVAYDITFFFILMKYKYYYSMNQKTQNIFIKNI